jgi:hypothetical protein
MITAGCARLGIEIPIIQAPMGGAVGPALAAAVSNAGGLGTLALWTADIPTLRQQVRETRALTGKPFAVNLVLEFPQEERLEACLQEGVPVISFFWREPSALVARAKSGGAVVLHTVGTAAEARHAVESGVDVVVARMGSRWPCAWKRRNNATHSRSGRCCRTSSGYSRGGYRRWSWACCSLGTRRFGGLDRNPISCKQRGSNSSALSRSNLAGNRR